MPRSTSELPPGPPLPRWAQTLALTVARRRFVDTCHRRYGGALTLRTMFGPPVVTLLDPALVERVFRTPAPRLHKGRLNSPLEPVFGRRSLVLLDGREHLRRRKLIVPAFHGERLRSHAALMRDATDREIDSWPVGEPFSLMASMQALTMTVIMGAVFGIVGSRREQFEQSVRAIFEPARGRRQRVKEALTGGRFSPSSRRRLDATVARIDDLLYGEIHRRRGAVDLEQRDDVLSTLLTVRDEDGRPLTDEELRCELVTLLLAGHASTATSLAWAFEQLLLHPQVESRLAADLQAGRDDYLDAVVSESLRVRTAIPDTGRVVGDEPFELGDHVLPPGTRIAVAIDDIHRRPDLHAEPEGFRPERFLGPDRPAGATWLPFGGGVRRCVGASFATFQMRIVIRRVLERTSLVLADRRPDRPVMRRVTARRGISVVPRRGVRVVQLRPSRPPAAAAGPVAQTEVLSYPW